MSHTSHPSQIADTTKNILYSQIILANKIRCSSTFHPHSLDLTSNFNHQQSPYNNGNDKASSGETASSQQTMTLSVVYNNQELQAKLVAKDIEDNCGMEFQPWN